MSGLVDENDRCVFGEYPGKLREILGIWVEETDALRPEEKNRMLTAKGSGLPRDSYDCGFLCDLLHLRGAEALAVYGDDFYAGLPCATRNRFGRGTAYYIGTEPEDAFLSDLLTRICRETGLSGLFPSDPGVEVTCREGEEGTVFFVLNHNATEASVDFGAERFADLLTGQAVTGRRTLASRDVLVLRREAL